MKSQVSTNFFGAKYLSKRAIVKSSPEEQYSYVVYSGAHEVELESGDSCFWLAANKRTANLSRGAVSISSAHFAVTVRGYAPPYRTMEIQKNTNLPYINGCSTRQIFPPERPGDPTWQLLKIPPATSEQLHHIHPTPRVVYVLEGEGVSVVGTRHKMIKQVLRPGMVCIIDPMCPHHFETKNQALIVLPVHVWSSVADSDFDHPMHNGTLSAQ